MRKKIRKGKPWKRMTKKKVEMIKKEEVMRKKKMMEINCLGT